MKKKYIITNNLLKVYDTLEEARQEFDKQLNVITNPAIKGAFKTVYTIAPLYVS